MPTLIDRVSAWYRSIFVAISLAWGSTLGCWVGAQEWSDSVLPISLNVGYAVRLVDLNKDHRLDIAIVDSKRIVWLENPTWQTHVIWETPNAPADNVCFAPHDIDGDGDIDFAVGYDWQPNNTASGGAVGWLECPVDPRTEWQHHPLTNNEPTTHRMQWADIDGDQRKELVVAPLKGKNAAAPGWDQVGVRLSRWDVPNNPQAEWPNTTIENTLPVMHNFQVLDFDRDGRDDLLLASFEGAHLWSRKGKESERTLLHLGTGHEGRAPEKGASEIRLGRIDSQRRFIATVEPWHGNFIVVYEEPTSSLTGTLWPRQVIDDQLKWGHSVACANLDDDQADELIIGVRDESTPHRCGVRLYDRRPDGSWHRTLIHPGQVAVEDLAVGDLDGDGRNEIVAVGRATKNAVIYRAR
jgi:hypothetical protein